MGLEPMTLSRGQAKCQWCGKMSSVHEGVGGYCSSACRSEDSANEKAGCSHEHVESLEFDHKKGRFHGVCENCGVNMMSTDVYRDLLEDTGEIMPSEWRRC